MIMAAKRIEWLDIAKGIGILLVVAGHCIPLSDPLCQLIFVFHMPLFFLLSGYTASAKDGFFTTVIKKAKTLLLPFAAFFLLGLAATLALPSWRQGLTADGLKQDLLLADPSHVHNSSIWFLVCLFFVVLVFWGIKKMPIWLQIPLILGIYMVGIWYARTRSEFDVFGYHRLPLNLDVVPTGLLFYAIGFYMRRYSLVETVSKHILAEVLVTVVTAAATLLIYQKNGYVNTHGLIFNDPLLFALGGLFGSLCVIGLSLLLARFTKEIFLDIKRLLMWYGRNSLLILGFQSLLIRLYVVLMNTYKHTALGMYSFPWSHAINCTILVAFVVAPLMAMTVNAVKRGANALSLRRKGTR